MPKSWMKMSRDGTRHYILDVVNLEIPTPGGSLYSVSFLLLYLIISSYFSALLPINFSSVHVSLML